MTYRYYLMKDFEREPYALFRERFDDLGQEVLGRAGDGWTPSSALWIYRAGGEIDESDQITEDEAVAIADAWGHDLSAAVPTNPPDDHRSDDDTPPE